EILTDQAWRIRQALNAQGFPDVDHVELVGPPVGAGASARNFVLCPGKAYVNAESTLLIDERNPYCWGIR
ncbi:MAG: hypothetical protein HY467_03530, partial [Betaproteobacteria bacterium]|nr:hypothetical protein [Betaproteobacteria bacterium]